MVEAAQLRGRPAPEEMLEAHRATFVELFLEEE